jgi:carbonic anhydrase/acetyltransferase-like protein (isoleucine patch superfamily)
VKYKFTGETKTIFGRTLHQIVCVTAFASTAAGDVGGWIEKEGNLSQSGNAWVYGNARVSGNAQVYGDAWVSGDAWVFGNAWVYGNAQVSGNARVFGNAWVYGNAQVSGNAQVYGNAQVSGDAQVYGNAQVSGNARVFGNAWVSGNARVLIGSHEVKDICILQIQGSAHPVCSPDGAVIKIGCQERTPQDWQENFESVGKSNGYTEAQIVEYKRYIDLFSVVLSERAN